MTRVLVIDNYDSFVYNLVQYLGELGAEPVVHRNDAIDARRASGRSRPTPSSSRPVPARPEDAGVVDRRHPRASASDDPGARRLPRPPVHRRRSSAATSCGRRALMHGKTSADPPRRRGRVRRAARPLHGDPLPLAGRRARRRVPDVLEVTARTDDGVIMGLRHRELAVEGVQFHPESILTERGHDLLRNFLAASHRAPTRGSQGRRTRYARSTTARPSATSDASASVSSRPPASDAVAQARDHDTAPLAERPRERRLTRPVLAVERTAGRAPARSGHFVHRGFARTCRRARRRSMSASRRSRPCSGRPMRDARRLGLTLRVSRPADALDDPADVDLDRGNVGVVGLARRPRPRCSDRRPGSVVRSSGQPCAAIPTPISQSRRARRG